MAKTILGKYMLRDDKIEDFEYPLEDETWKLTSKEMDALAIKIPRIIEVDIPKGILEIEMKAFSKLEELKTVSIPKSVYKIYSGAFDNCNSLEEAIFEDLDTNVLCYLAFPVGTKIVYYVK